MEPVASRRRNGLRPSCEPCRISKLRCDHATPKCGRCISSGKSDRCVYHPAPLTGKTLFSTGAGEDAEKRKRVKRRRVEESLSTTGNEVSILPASTSPPTLSPSVPDVQPLRKKDKNDNPEKSSRASWTYQTEQLYINHPLPNWRTESHDSRVPGFLGLSSYSAVFSEQNINISDLLPERRDNSLDDDAPVADALRPTKIATENADDLASARRIELGCQLLRHLDDLPLYEKILDEWLERDQSLVYEPLVRMMFDLVKMTYESTVKKSKKGNSASLANLSKRLFDNFDKPIELHVDMTPATYVNQIALRWEIIGLLFSLMGQAALRLRYWEPYFKSVNRPTVERKDFAIFTAAVGDVCWKFCDNARVKSDPLCWMLSNHTCLLTMVYGDHDYRASRKLSELCSSVVALGLHQPLKADKIPFFLLELRRTVMGGTYLVDKCLSTFLGRPPRISRRFCAFELPFDLGIDVLMGGHQVQQSALRKLDDQGWNTEGQVTAMVIGRAIVMMAFVQEEILELSLGHHATENLVQRVEEIRTRFHDIWSRIPSYLHWADEREHEIRSYRDKCRLLDLYLFYLYNEFLLDRILVKRLEIHRDELNRVSFRLLNSLLKLINLDIHNEESVSEIPFSTSFFGLPSAGVLALELLRQSQTPNDVHSTSFSRSEAIQSLSIFTSHLEYVLKPYDGNYEICQQARKAIRGVLDRVLSASSSSSAVAAAAPVAPSLITSSTVPSSTSSVQEQQWVRPSDPFLSPTMETVTDWWTGEVFLDGGTDFFRMLEHDSWIGFN